MLLGRYRFCCRFDQQSEMPADKSAALRRVFRRALKQAACENARKPCRKCQSMDRCVFPQVFRRTLRRAVKRNGCPVAAPYPFVLQPPKGRTTHYPAGSAVPFHLVLFGDINRQLTPFIEAFKHMGCWGLGPAADKKPARFYLRQVLYKGQVVYHHAQPNTYAFPVPERIGLDTFDTPEAGIDSIRVTLQSPLWLNLPNRFKPDLPFSTLVRALIGRARDLLACYNGGAPNLDRHRLLQQARCVRVTEQNLRLTARSSDTCSRSQDQSPYLVGSVAYQGPLDEFWPLIQFGVQTHIGRQAAFGLGRIAVQATAKH